MFKPYLLRWGLVPDGDPITTAAARLLPVVRSGEPAMLKLSVEEDERSGGVLMAWWDGGGAARVLARDDDALLLEPAMGPASLAEMARTGQDDEACRVLCAVAARLHAPRAKPRPELIPLAHWFRELEPAAGTHGGILARCAKAARALLAESREVGVLHGDLHHDNVLDFGARGWLAIDPKGNNILDAVVTKVRPDAPSHCAPLWDFRPRLNSRFTPAWIFAREGTLRINELVRKSIGFLGILDLAGAFAPYGTGFLALWPENGLIFSYLVTAKHNIDDMTTTKRPMMYRLNDKYGGAQIGRIEMEHWETHQAIQGCDIAVATFLGSYDTFDIRGFDLVNDCLTDEYIARYDVGCGDAVYMTGLLTKHFGLTKNIPIVRIGNIASMPDEPIDLDKLGSCPWAWCRSCAPWRC